VIYIEQSSVVVKLFIPHEPMGFWCYHQGFVLESFCILILGFDARAHFRARVG